MVAGCLPVPIIAMPLGAGGVLDREALDQEELPIESKVVRLTRPDA
jgi:hypothetical protein